MTETSEPTPKPIPAKTAAPGLQTRAPRPPAVRLRQSVVKGVAITGGILVSGALAWAFVIQPDLRASALNRASEARDDESRGVVRPAEIVTDQPSSYDRLPEPRTVRPEEPVPPAPTGRQRPPAPYRSEYAPRTASRVAGPSPRQLAARAGVFFEDPTQSQAVATRTAPSTGSETEHQSQRAADYGALYNGHTLVAPLSPFELKAGAIVPAALLTAIDTSREGPVIATVTQNIFDSISGRHLLVPQGTRLIGRSGGDSSYGDRRAFVTWQRLILPNGKSLILSDEAGVDAQGAVGVRGQVDRRLLPLLVGTLFAGAITTLGQVARSDGDASRSMLGDAGDAAAIEGAQVGGRLVDRELQVRPSIRLQAGAPVRVLITRDLILEPYQP